MNSEIIIFSNGEIKLEVNVNEENIWLTQSKIAELFDVDRSVVTKHLKNIFDSNELKKDSVCAKIAHTAKDGKKYNTMFFNLDAIITVGYRINSKKATMFRIWATKILKEFMIQGYSINQKRLEYLERTIKIIDIANRIDNKLEAKNANEILIIIGNYVKSLEMLDNYDYKRMFKIEGIKSNIKITYRDCIRLIYMLKDNQNSSLFAIEKYTGLKGIIENIYQTYDEKELYPTIQEKAANFLYLIIKDHIFIDGNKRIAATLFIFFLFSYDILYINNKQTIDNKTLTALILLIAESHPNEKEVIINLTLNFLCE